MSSVSAMVPAPPRRRRFRRPRLGWLLGWRRVLFFEVDLRRCATVDARVPLEMRAGTLADLDRFAEDFGRVMPLDVARGRLERGEHLLIAVSGDRLVHVQWVATTGTVWLVELAAWLDVPPGVAYLYHAVTLPEWRGRGIHGAARAFANRYQRELGYERELSWVWADNAPAVIVTQRQLGGTHVGTAWVVRVAGAHSQRAFVWSRSGTPRLRHDPDVPNRPPFFVAPPRRHEDGDR